jgi:hypothetical protein
MACRIPTTPTLPAIANRARRVASALHRMRVSQMLATLAQEIARYEANDDDTATLETEFAELAHDLASGKCVPCRCAVPTLAEADDARR